MLWWFLSHTRKPRNHTKSHDNHSTAETCCFFNCLQLKKNGKTSSDRNLWKYVVVPNPSSLVGTTSSILFRSSSKSTGFALALLSVSASWSRRKLIQALMHPSGKVQTHDNLQIFEIIKLIFRHFLPIIKWYSFIFNIFYWSLMIFVACPKSPRPKESFFPTQPVSSPRTGERLIPPSAWTVTVPVAEVLSILEGWKVLKCPRNLVAG